MRKLSLLLAMAGISFSQVCNEEYLKEHLPFMPERVKIVSKRELQGICEFVIKDGANIFPIYVSKDFALAGSMFSKGQNLTAQGIAQARQSLLKEYLPRLNGIIATKHGTAEKTLYMVSDPDCPYCESSKKRVYEMATQRGWSVALIWFPLPNNQKGREKAISFVCEKRTWQDYLNGTYGTSKCEEGQRKVQESLNLMQEFGIGGTPTFILSTGQVIEGANFRALEEALK